MKYIPYSISSGASNMKIDEDILDNAILTKSQTPIFRLYGWSPKCISLGRNQKDTFIDYEFIKQNNIDVVRRLTGGRALLHDSEITYSFVCSEDYLKDGHSVIMSYKEISSLLIDVFKTLGIDLSLGGDSSVHTKFDYCMLISTGADLCYKNKKFIGSAQCRKQGYILQHGSILLDYDRELLEKLFNEEVSTNSIISLKEINPDLTIDTVVKAFEKKMSSS